MTRHAKLHTVRSYLAARDAARRRCEKIGRLYDGERPGMDSAAPMVFALAGVLVAIVFLACWGQEFGQWFDALWEVTP